jgi:hypothetical protein
MMLTELTNIKSLETAQSTAIKGGARDTRRPTSTSTSTLGAGTKIV